MVKTYKIHPAIGIGRLGESDDWFVGPETADAPTPHRTPYGALRRRAALAEFTVLVHALARRLGLKPATTQTRVSFQLPRRKSTTPTTAKIEKQRPRVTNTPLAPSPV